MNQGLRAGRIGTLARVGSKKKRNAAKKPKQRQGLSGNPQRRAEQLEHMKPVSEAEAFRDLARLMAGGAEPATWWPESHGRILDAAVDREWPSDPAGVEALTCELVGDEFYSRVQSPDGGLHPEQWLVVLVQETADELRLAVEDGSGDWRGLHSLLCGLTLTAPLPAPEEGKGRAFAREHFPDILDPYEVARDEAAGAATLLADHGLSPAIASVSDGARPSGDTLMAREAYGSRFLVVAPFGYGGETDHWYAWDTDQCWVDVTAAAGAFGSAAEALAEWQQSVGAAAAGSTLEPCPAPMLPVLLSPCLQTGPLADALMGGESREHIREYYRMRRRARVLAWGPDAPDASGSSGEPTVDVEAALAAFREWYGSRHDEEPKEFDLIVGTIVDHWGPLHPADDRAFYACSPHRIEYTARLLRDGYDADEANESLAVLPEWTQWCLAQCDPGEEFAARAMKAARAEAADLMDPYGDDARPDPSDEGPLRRAE